MLGRINQLHDPAALELSHEPHGGIYNLSLAGQGLPLSTMIHSLWPDEGCLAEMLLCF